MTNEYLAPFVDELFNLGVREAVFSPGSRSTALAMLFEEYKKYDTYVNIDERSAAFFALGIAKANRRPVVLVCTSGSAAAHHFPAITEAKMSRIPLIILTADRPAELQFVGAPQTLDQTRFFGNFVNHFENLEAPQPQAKNFWTYPRKVAQRAFLSALDQMAGPVQINIPLRDPLVPELKSENYEKGRSKLPFKFFKGQQSVSFDEALLSSKTLILAGANSSENYSESLLKLAEHLKAPILADPLSNLRNHNSPFVMDSYDAFLANDDLKTDLKAESILLFGQMPVSKRLQQFIALNDDAEFIQVDPALAYRNPSLTTTITVQSNVATFANSIQKVNQDFSYLEKWQKAQEKMRHQLEKVAQEENPFEGRFVQELQKHLKALDAQLLVSNSMEIRDIDYWWKKEDSKVRILGNRGVNGIDGTESTALGIATTGKPTVLLTGDLSMLHDLNGLIIGKTHELNLTIVLFNNDGGGIFHHLAQKGVPNFDYLFSTPHGLNFEGLAELTGLDYHLVSNYADFGQQFETSIRQPGIHLLEIKTDKDLSLALHKKYTAYEN
ncbi:2-succinyl-5-enolpyruvyl-6-hydroxy-3-cyclohexene-1- carboxylic-acid synthase, menD [Lactococcus cremoris]|uniref:2-succinyl-5-enolpyruvyl-6-hydroxy-3- cyclohexene-1-carboxylic-acid synthase n=1 Tax=Lactococcus lactis subsp. cremoris TaxID=1359 RepID=UPI000629DDA8|nr:2-succinyl-5-enolpyruvyl-6-hydroxy-3-cyclohexene-1-carboxylic-acid synthase [Lactococcus cremoris]KKW72048.1 2-succinyl-5-enolpyruvyl-6-hydroxy-3-cyclohexene-1- carboxylic-acid synthase, menD [Lactococcus cremoris]RDG21917.1 2-succinyl-5-enolpyruvyl-6-hydroxy-3-cyclohexene-1-carboxylic-acid synthase [Lactococcus cremoris]